MLRMQVKKKNGKKSNKLSLDEDSNSWWNSINGGQEKEAGAHEINQVA